MMGLSLVKSVSKSLIGQAVGMLAVGLELHQIDDVDDADFQLGQALAQDGRRRPGFPAWARRRRRP